MPMASSYKRNRASRTPLRLSPVVASADFVQLGNRFRASSTFRVQVGLCQQIQVARLVWVFESALSTRSVQLRPFLRIKR